MKVGCCVDAREIDAALGCGFDFLDLNGQELVGMSLHEVRKLAGKMGDVACRGIHAAVPAHIRMTGWSMDLNRVKEYFSCLARRMEVLKVRYLGIGSPASRTLPLDFSQERADQQMRAVLAEASRAYPQGLVLLESLNTGETNYINTIAHAARVVDGLDASRVGLVLDVYHLVLCGEGLDAVTKEVAGRIHYMHIADPVGRAFPSYSTDPSLFDLTRRAARATGVEEIAIEAKTKNLAQDAKRALDILAKVL